MATFVAAAAGVYAALGLLLYFAQRSLLYFPTPAVDLPGAKLAELQANGETLRIWTRPADGPRALIYFGGNAEDVAGSYAPLSAALPGHSLYLVNYRGYGGSSGSPTEEGLFADALAVYDHVRERHSQVDVVGTSLGSGVAMYLAEQRPVGKLVLVTPYDSIAKVAAGHYPLFPVSYLIKDRFESFKRVAGVTAPALVVVAEHDDVIPRARTDALVAKFPKEQVRVEVIAGAGHNDVADSPRYLEYLRGFLEPGR